MPILPPNLHITIFLLVYYASFSLLVILLRNVRVFGRRLADYLRPNVIFFLITAGAVWSQYAICLGTNQPRVCSLAQTVWVGAVAVSTALPAKRAGETRAGPPPSPRSPARLTDPRLQRAGLTIPLFWVRENFGYRKGQISPRNLAANLLGRTRRPPRAKGGRSSRP